MERLTTTQARVLEFIERWFEQRGRAPSVREITRGLGLKSSSGVQYHMRARERRGLIDCGRARGGRIWIVRRSVQLADPRRELTGETERQVTEAPHRLVTATLPPPSREYLSRAELARRQTRRSTRSEGDPGAGQAERRGDAAGWRTPARRWRSP